jgi:hypothetical protein
VRAPLLSQCPIHRPSAEEFDAQAGRVKKEISSARKECEKAEQAFKAKKASVRTASPRTGPRTAAPAYPEPGAGAVADICRCSSMYGAVPTLIQRPDHWQSRRIHYPHTTNARTHPRPSRNAWRRNGRSGAEARTPF